MRRSLRALISPPSSDISPTMRRSSVVLPAPFGPTRPTRMPGLMCRLASSRSTWLPKDLEMSVM